MDITRALQLLTFLAAMVALAAWGIYRDRKEHETIEDGFGSVWSAYCPECGRRSMGVMRPGKVQCGYCG